MIANHVRANGGVKVIYLAVGSLRRHGFDACVATAVGMPGWLAGSRALADVEILDMAKPQSVAPADLYVAADAIGPHRVPLLLSRPERRVLYIQNHNPIRHHEAVDRARLRPIRCPTVSAFQRRFLVGKGGF